MSSDSELPPKGRKGEVFKFETSDFGSLDDGWVVDAGSAAALSLELACGACFTVAESPLDAFPSAIGLGWAASAGSDLSVACRSTEVLWAKFSLAAAKVPLDVASSGVGSGGMLFDSNPIQNREDQLTEVRK